MKNSNNNGMDEFYRLIKFATPEQRANLASLTEAGFGDSPQSLCNHIRWLRAGTIGQMFYDESWKQVVTDVADQVGIDWPNTLRDRPWQILPTADIETAIVKTLFQIMVESLSPQQQQQLLSQLQGSHHNPEFDTLLATAGVMAVARMSGFGVYLMASTVLGGLTQAVGLTLPFAVYMGMSQAIALVLGPAGWLALSGGLLHAINQPQWERLTRAVVYVALIRASRDAPPEPDWEGEIAHYFNENLRQAKIERANRERIEFWRSRDAEFGQAQ